MGTMRDAMKLLGAMALTAVIGASASAQSIGGGSTSGGGSSAGTTGGGTGGAGGTGSNQTSDLQVITTPPITGVSAYGGNAGSTNSAINTSNFLRNTFSNVHYQGRANAQANEIPGGFGQILYTSGGSGSTGGNIGFAGGTSGGLGSVTGSSSASGGRGAGGIGGTTGRGAGGIGGGSSISSSTVGGQIVPLARPIAYQGVLKFQPPATPPGQLQAELRSMIDRSTMIRNPRDVSIQIDGPGIILRGTAQDEDEAHMIEGMVRLTPGVHFVTNELQYPRP